MVKNPREDEIQRREAAQASVADVQPGGSEVERRSIKQMVSVRLEARLLKEIRALAIERGLSISDLLREAAIGLVERSRPGSAYVSLWSAGTPQIVPGRIMPCPTAASGAAVTLASQPAVSAGDDNINIGACLPIRQAVFVRRVQRPVTRRRRRYVPRWASPICDAYLPTAPRWIKLPTVTPPLASPGEPRTAGRRCRRAGS